MRISRGLAVRLGVSVLLLIVLFLTAQHAFAAGAHGCEGGNLISNCNFDGPFTERGQPEWKLPPGWEPFVLGGSLSFREHTDTYWGAPSVEMVSDGTTFDAGVYTQVGGLQPGATYRASVGWFAAGAPADSFCRKLGIDPTGGTNAGAPSVIWGPTFCGHAAMLNYAPPDTPNIDVSAVARNSTITVFANAQHTFSTGVNYIFLDALELVQDNSAPAAPPPTDTPPPPTAAPPTAAPPPTAQPEVVQLQPTARPTLTPTSLPTATETAAPTSTYTPSPTSPPTRTATPLPTDTPSITPSSTLPPRPSATPAPPGEGNPFAASGTGGGSAPSGLLFGGFGALGIAAMLGVALVVTRKK